MTAPFISISVSPNF